MNKTAFGDFASASERWQELTGNPCEGRPTQDHVGKFWIEEEQAEDGLRRKGVEYSLWGSYYPYSSDLPAMPWCIDRRHVPYPDEANGLAGALRQTKRDPGMTDPWTQVVLRKAGLHRTQFLPVQEE